MPIYAPDGRAITSAGVDKDHYRGWDPIYAKVVELSWEGDDAFITEIYEQYLAAANADKLHLATTFPEYCRACIETLNVREKEIIAEVKKTSLRPEQKDAMFFILNKGRDALKAYLELPPEKRLIGV